MARIDRALQLRDDRAELRPAARRRRLARMVAVEDLDGVVIGLVADERADDDELVHDPGQPRQRLADLDAGDVGRDRPPRAGDLLRRVGLEVEHVLVRRPADQVDQDDRLRATTDTPACASARNRPGNVRPPSPSAPIWRNPRRERLCGTEIRVADEPLWVDMDGLEAG